MFNIGDKFIMGQYPDGSLYELSNNNTLDIFSPTPTPINKKMPSHRELQSILKIKNNLVTGIWPWGEVWIYDDKKWKQEIRLFNEPKVSSEKSPYESTMRKLNETGKIKSEFDIYGQRVPSIETIGNKIYIATSSKSGINHLYPDFVKNSDAYGHIYEFEISNSLTCEVNYTETQKSLLEFIYDEKNKKLAIKQDNQLLCEAYV